MGQSVVGGEAGGGGGGGRQSGDRGRGVRLGAAPEGQGDAMDGEDIVGCAADAVGDEMVVAAAPGGNGSDMVGGRCGRGRGQRGGRSVGESGQGRG